MTIKTPEGRRPLPGPGEDLRSERIDDASEDLPVGAEELAVLRDLLAQPEGAYRRFVAEYRASARKCAADLRAALAGGEASLAERAAHTLRGSSGNVGARRLAGLCQLVEDAALKGEPAGLLPLAFAIEAELARVLAALEASL